MEDALMHDLTAGYALDALQPEQARTYENHLARCQFCREELGDFVELAGQLAFATPPAPPPAAALRQTILAAARAELGQPERSRPPWAVPSLTVAVTASAAAVALGIWTAAQPSSSHLRALPLRGTPGALVVSGNHSAVLVASGLPPAPDGQTYEIWLMRAGTPARPAGLFGADHRTVRAPLTHPVPSGSFVGVTIERAGGTRRPTGPPLFTSSTD
jgi:hypothetical protein